MAQDPTRPETIPLGPEAIARSAFEKAILTIVPLVRSRMRDHTELNRLVAGEESSNKQIALAVLEVVDDWNHSPPLIEGVTLATFPSVSLLLTATVARLLEQIAFLQIRNHVQYTDGQGVTVSPSANGRILKSWAAAMEAEYGRKRDKLKMALNLQGAMTVSGIKSEYSWVNNLFDSTDWD